MKKIKIPSVFLLTSCLVSAVLNNCGVLLRLPKGFVLFAQVLSGVVAGSAVKPGDIKKLKKVLFPFILLIFLYFLAVLFSGIVITCISPVDIKTAFFLMIPSGMTDMCLSAEQFGADAGIVLAMQTLRNVVGVCFFPTLICFAAPVYDSPLSSKINVKSGSGGLGVIPLKLMVLSLISGFGMYYLFGGNAAFLTSLIVSIIYVQLSGKEIRLSHSISVCAQLLAGISIGSRLLKDKLLPLGAMLVPAFILIIVYFLFFFFCGRLMNRLFNIPLREAMLCCLPAGASNMAVIASGMQVKSLNLIVIQSARWTLCAMLFPPLFSFIASLMRN